MITMAKIKIVKIENLETGAQVTFQYTDKKGGVREGSMSFNLSATPEAIKQGLKALVKETKKEITPEVQALLGEEFEE